MDITFTASKLLLQPRNALTCLASTIDITRQRSYLGQPNLGGGGEPSTSPGGWRRDENTHLVESVPPPARLLGPTLCLVSLSRLSARQSFIPPGESGVNTAGESSGVGRPPAVTWSREPLLSAERSRGIPSSSSRRNSNPRMSSGGDSRRGWGRMGDDAGLVNVAVKTRSPRPGVKTAG